MQFKLVQRGFDLFLIDAFIGDALQGLQNQLFHLEGGVFSTSLKTADETHLPVAVFQAAQRGGGFAKVGGFQHFHQRAGAVVEQYGAHQLRFECRFQINALTK